MAEALLVCQRESDQRYGLRSALQAEGARCVSLLERQREHFSAAVAQFKAAEPGLGVPPKSTPRHAQTCAPYFDEGQSVILLILVGISIVGDGASAEGMSKRKRHRSISGLG